MKKIMHLLSGGLDSVTLLHQMHGEGHQVHCLLVDYGQQHVKELQFAQQHCEQLGVLWTRMAIPRLGGLVNGQWVVPGRNAILISLAAALAMRATAESVTIGCNADDEAMFPDCSRQFIQAMNEATKGGYGVELCAPFIGARKWQIAAMAKEMGVRDVWYCYAGGERPCGECPACQKMKALP